MINKLGPYELSKVHQGDCLELMRELPDKCFHLLFADPPYGIDKAFWDKEYPTGIEKEFLRLANAVYITPGQQNLAKCITILNTDFVGIISARNKNGMTFSNMGFEKMRTLFDGIEKDTPK
jgi:DNA modification methylase